MVARPPRNERVNQDQNKPKGGKAQRMTAWKTRSMTGISVILVIGLLPLSAHAGWGCLGRSRDRLDFRTWHVDDQEDARSAVLSACLKEGHPGCHIVACRENVDTQARAFAVWPGEAPIRCYHCGR